MSQKLSPSKTTRSVSKAVTGYTQSLQSDNGGTSYYTQTAPNAGTVPCCAPGTLIDTPDGPRAVETLQPGDRVATLDNGPQEIRWVRSSDQPLEAAEKDAKPVLIAASALGGKLPAQDLIVSPQHRILVGGHSFDARRMTLESPCTLMSPVKVYCHGYFLRCWSCTVNRLMDRT